MGTSGLEVVHNGNSHNVAAKVPRQCTRRIERCRSRRAVLPLTGGLLLGGESRHRYPLAPGVPELNPTRRRDDDPRRRRPPHRSPQQAPRRRAPQGRRNHRSAIRRAPRPRKRQAHRPRRRRLPPLPPRMRGGPIGSVGSCLGGGLSALLACENPDVGAAAIYYGASPTAEQVASIRCHIRSVYGKTTPESSSSSRSSKPRSRPPGWTTSCGSIRTRPMRSSMTRDRATGPRLRGMLGRVLWFLRRCLGR